MNDEETGPGTKDVPVDAVPGMAGRESTDDRWEELLHELSGRVPVFTPDWTDVSNGDPGTTLVQLFAFLGESLLSRVDLSSQSRTRLREVLERLAERAHDPACQDGTLTRNHFFTGKFLTVNDLALEQAYHRTRQRRHNRLLHGIGIVRGLGVGLEPRPDGGDPTIVVSPGLAISSDGEELIVCDPVSRDLCQGVSVCYVTLSLGERPAALTHDGGHSRIEESTEVAVSDDVPARHLAIARLIHDGASWCPDASFEPLRATPR